MTCSESLELAPLHLTGELDAARTAAIAEHISKCAACRRELAEQSAFDELLRRSVAADPVDTSALGERVRAGIHAGQRRPKHWLVATAGIAAALTFGIVAWREMQLQRPNPLDSAAARDHHIELVDHQPRPWLTDRAAIEGLATKQGLQASLVSTLTPSGYHLSQGKLCFLHGQIFLHLVYENNAGNVSVFLRHAEVLETSDIHLVNFEFEHTARFQRGQLTAVLVTDQPGQAVQHLAESAEAAL